MKTRGRPPYIQSFFFLTIAVWTIFSTLPAYATETVTLQLKWLHQFQFAGFYAAKEKGYYRDAGLEVNILEAKPDKTVVDSVTGGEAQYGVDAARLLLARAEGKPVVALGVIFQHSAYILVTRHGSPVQNIHNLSGKRLMLEDKADEVLAYLKKEGLSSDRFTLVKHTFNPQDLISGTVDAISAYSTNELFFLDKAGFRYNAYSPRSAGIDFYGDTIFTTEQELKKHPARVKAFREATLRGWKYAMANQEEIVDLIIARYSQRKSREHLLFEAGQMKSLIQPDLIELGYMNPGRWQHIADTYADLGMLPRNFSIDGFIYDPAPKHNHILIRNLALILAAGLLGASLFVIVLRRQVRSKTQDIEAAAEQYQTILHSTTDGFWCVGRDGRLIDVNERYVDLSGYSREELIGIPVELLEQIDTKEDVQKRINTLVESGFIRFESRHRRKNGTVWDVEVSSSYLPSKNKMIVFIRDITQRRHSENELLKSENKFRALTENAPVGIYLTDQSGYCLYTNKKWQEMSGLTAEESAGRGWEKGLHPEDRDSITDNWYRSVQSGGQWGYEYRCITLEGKITWVYGNAFPLYDNDGEITGYIGTIVDITDRKRMESATNKRLIALTQPLESGTVTFDELFNIDEVQRLQDEFARATGVASLITNPDGTPLTAPSNFTRLCSEIIRKTDQGCSNCIKSDASLGRHSTDGPKIQPCMSGGLWDAGASISVGGQHIANWLIGQVRDETQTEEEMAAYARQIGVDEAYFLEAFREVPSMSLKQFENVARVLFTVANQLSTSAYQNIQQARFINERKQSEEQLMSLAQRLQLATSSTHLGIWDWNVKENTMVWDDRMFELYGITRESFPNSINAWMTGLHPEDKEAAIAECQEALKGEKEFDTEFRVLHPDGTVKYIKGKGLALMGAEGNAERMIGINYDITDLKHAEEEKHKLESQLQQAQKMESVGRLAGGVAHDFNNMLCVIIGHAELGLMRLDPANPVRSDLNEIKNSAERSANLTRQLLAFARKQTICPKEIDLNDTVTNMLKMLQRLIGEHIQLTWQPSPDRCLVKMDPSQIDQILANLCVNARDAILDTGRISIETGTCSINAEYCAANPEAMPGDYVRLAVSDNGRGMDRETITHIFEPFYTTKEMGKGTGLGLATVYGAVKQNNGFINILSEPDKGTTFIIHLPNCAENSIQQQAEDYSQAVPLGQETILLVEDEAAILNITAIMLEKQGYRVLRANSPGQAMELAREHQGAIHLLMTDVIMPEMNGRELAKNILAIYPAIKRLFMSGYTADVIAHHGVLDQGVHFIQKPFSMPNMATKVREVLDNS